jgi:hypothetical protein
MATEIPDGCTRWKASGNWVMTVSNPAQDAVSVAEAQRNPFASIRELKGAVWIATGIESYSLTNLHLAQQMVGQF